jgi:hypothetical protein
MDLIRAKDFLLQTHLAALGRGERPNAYQLMSSPGVGKSDSIFQTVEMLTQALNQPVGLVVFMLATITSPDVRGFMIPIRNPEGGLPITVFSVPPWMPRPESMWVCEPQLIGDLGDEPVRWHEAGTWSTFGGGGNTKAMPEVGVLFLDEWGQAEDDVKKPAAELLLNGRVGNWKLPKTWRVISASNRTSDRSGVLRELMFIINRRGALNIEARLQPWLKWVETQRDHLRPHYLTVSFAQQHPNVVFRDTVPEGYDQYCTPRSLCLMDKDLRGIRTQAQEERGELLDLNDPVAHEMVASWIGTGAAGQYLAHLKYADQMPAIEDIVNGPMGAKLPAGQDGQMVCAFKLVEYIDPDNAGAFLKYISRMHQDMGVFAVNTINADDRRARFVFPLPEYREFARKNKQVLFAAHS